MACDSKIKDRPPTYKCQAPMVNAYVKMWADSTCSCSSHSGPFGCVLTLTCQDGSQNSNVTEVYYGEKSRWIEVISLLKSHKNKDINLVGARAAEIFEMINKNGYSSFSEDMNTQIRWLNNSLESLPSPAKEELLTEFNRLFLSFTK
ncbi:MAG: hypothetical protein WBO36_17045 [Saprospiraceae bacterium]